MDSAAGRLKQAWLASLAADIARLHGDAHLLRLVEGAAVIDTVAVEADRFQNLDYSLEAFKTEAELVQTLGVPNATHRRARLNGSHGPTRLRSCVPSMLRIFSRSA